MLSYDDKNVSTAIDRNPGACGLSFCLKKRAAMLAWAGRDQVNINTHKHNFPISKPAFSGNKSKAP